MIKRVTMFTILEIEYKVTSFFIIKFQVYDFSLAVTSRKKKSRNNNLLIRKVEQDNTKERTLLQ